MLPTRPCAAIKAAVQKLIEQHADVNAAQADGATALHWAVFRSDKEMVDLLLQRRRESQGRQPRGLHAVVAGEHQRRCRHHRGAAQRRGRSQREASAGKDSSDGCVAHRQCRRDEGAAGPRRGREREGNSARNHPADVGRRRRPCARDPASDRARRRYQGALRSGRARKRAGAREIERSEKSGRGAGRGAGCRKASPALGAFVATRTELPEQRARRRPAASARRRGRAVRAQACGAAAAGAADQDDGAAAAGFGRRGPPAPQRWRSADAAGLCGPLQRSRFGQSPAGRRSGREPDHRLWLEPAAGGDAESVLQARSVSAGPRRRCESHQQRRVDAACIWPPTTAISNPAIIRSARATWIIWSSSSSFWTKAPT